MERLKKYFEENKVLNILGLERIIKVHFNVDDKGDYVVKSDGFKFKINFNVGDNYSVIYFYMAYYQLFKALVRATRELIPTDNGVYTSSLCFVHGKENRDDFCNSFEIKMGLGLSVEDDKYIVRATTMNEFTCNDTSKIFIPHFISNMLEIFLNKMIDDSSELHNPIINYSGAKSLLSDTEYINDANMVKTYQHLRATMYIGPRSNMSALFSDIWNYYKLFNFDFDKIDIDKTFHGTDFYHDKNVIGLIFNYEPTTGIYVSINHICDNILQMRVENNEKVTMLEMEFEYNNSPNLFSKEDADDYVYMYYNIRLIRDYLKAAYSHHNNKFIIDNLNPNIIGRSKHYAPFK
jgi:hypothetical protein